MRPVRLVPRWKPLGVAGACASLSILVTGALASPSRPAVGRTLQLVLPATAGCRAPNRVGFACVDRPAIPEWTVDDGVAIWDHTSGVGGLWETKYSWRVPRAVTSDGGDLRFSVKATEKAGGRICPAIIITSGFPVTEKEQPFRGQLDVGVCAEGRKTASQGRAVTLHPPSAASVSTVALVIRVQDGPIYTYTYRAVKEKGAVNRLTVYLKQGEGFVPDKATLRNGGTVRFCNRLGRAEILFSRSKHKEILFHSGMYDIALSSGCISRILRNPTKRPILLLIFANASPGWLHEDLELTVLP